MQIQDQIKIIKEDLPDLDLSGSSSYPEHILDYFKFYGIHFPEIRHCFGGFKACGFRIAAHIFMPHDEPPKGTVILMHGYYDHSGSLKHLIRKLVELKYAVAVYDLPGHGLSSGERAVIDDFGTYSRVFGEFLKLCRKSLPRPLHVIGHSTGCAVILDYILSGNDIPFNRIIFSAPLIRSHRWHLSLFGSRLISMFTDSIPRKFHESSSAKGFLEFLTKDPLQSRVVPFRWVKALESWNRKLKFSRPSSYRIFIIQGEQDKTVHWKYNLHFLKNKFFNSEILRIKNARHQLFNEQESIRDQVFESIENYLKH